MFVCIECRHKYRLTPALTFEQPHWELLRHFLSHRFSGNYKLHWNSQICTDLLMFCLLTIKYTYMHRYKLADAQKCIHDSLSRWFLLNLFFLKVASFTSENRRDRCLLQHLREENTASIALNWKIALDSQNSRALLLRVNWEPTF